MAAFKRGQKADGKYSEAAKLNPGPKEDPNGNAKGKDLSKEVYENNDSPAIRGTRPGFS